jgi:hypothetical protein
MKKGQERTRKGRERDKERTRKGQIEEKRTRDLFLFYMCLKELIKTRKDEKHQGYSLGVLCPSE